jgi:hypothetical protein
MLAVPRSRLWRASQSLEHAAASLEHALINPPSPLARFRPNSSCLPPPLPPHASQPGPAPCLPPGAQASCMSYRILRVLPHPACPTASCVSYRILRVLPHPVCPPPHNPKACQSTCSPPALLTCCQSTCSPPALPAAAVRRLPRHRRSRLRRALRPVPAGLAGACPALRRRSLSAARASAFNARLGTTPSQH